MSGYETQRVPKLTLQALREGNQVLRTLLRGTPVDSAKVMRVADLIDSLVICAEWGVGPGEARHIRPVQSLKSN